MPSAANVKNDKQISPENALADSSGGNLTPLRQAITVIEHKIRNLEKRKSKLESYKELQNAGKELNADQKNAVARSNEVIHTLEFARDICKQFLGIAIATEKEAKRLAKKEAAAKSQAELARLREILLVQDALNQMGNENVRDDFLNGRNGAAQLSETDLKLLDDLYPAVTPKHEAGNPTAFTNEVQAAAEHLLAVVDGKPKDVFGGSYNQIKDVLGKIHESGYFDQAQVFEDFAEDTNAASSAPENMLPVEQVSIMNHELIPQDQQQLGHAPPVQAMESLPMDILANKLHPQQALVEQQQPLEQPLPLQPQSIQPPEQVYYQQPAPPQPLRPISEMLGTGSFFFLQDSEIDPTPTEPPQQIPSQTFTNQTFVSTGPPPPIPLPPHFQTMPNNIPTNLPVSTTGNNGIIDETQQPPPHMKQQPDDLHKNMPVGMNHQRPTVNQRVNNNNSQSFYQNNNGYSNGNRPRQQQQHRNNGPRPGNNNNRHN